MTSYVPHHLSNSQNSNVGWLKITRAENEVQNRLHHSGSTKRNVQQLLSKQSLSVRMEKEGTLVVKMSLAADPDRKIPSYGWICMDWLMKDFQLPLFSNRSGHQLAECHSGTIKVPFSLPADMCLNTCGTRYGGGKSQLISWDQETVNASAATQPGLWYLLQYLSNCFVFRLANLSMVWGPHKASM